MDLRKILKKFTKQQLLNEAWGVLNVEDAEEPDMQHSTKEEMISYIIKVAKDASVNIKKLVLLLELKCCQIQAHKRQWHAVEIKNPKIFVEKTTVPERFAQKLSKYLNRSQFFCEVMCEFVNNVMWTIITTKQLKSHTNTFFLLAYANLPVLVHSTVKPNYQDIICRSLIDIFNGTDCRIHPMKSKNIDTLLLCVSQKLTAVDNVEDKLPFVRKKKCETEKAIVPYNVINEDYEEDLEREAYIKEIFGSFEQPIFPSLTYNITSNFFGFNEDEKPIPVACRVVFKGDNVLGGVQQLVEEGMADIPLPEYLTNVVHYGSNRFDIKQNAIEYYESQS